MSSSYVARPRGPNNRKERTTDETSTPAPVLKRWRLSPAAREISEAVLAHYERLAAAHVPPELAADLTRAYQAALLAARSYELVYQDT